MRGHPGPDGLGYWGADEERRVAQPVPHAPAEPQFRRARAEPVPEPRQLGELAEEAVEVAYEVAGDPKSVTAGIGPVCSKRLVK